MTAAAKLASTETATDSTPLMAQYFALKAQNPDCLLFFRVGDFYELFFDDAIIASRLLDIVLTKRGQHQGQDVPLCGVPVHAYESYIAKLIRSGQRVAVCEQMETPDEAKARAKLTKEKNIVRREVVRIITPGTITEDGLLDAAASYNLVAVVEVAGTIAVATTDLSHATPYVQTVDAADLTAELARVEPRELLVPERLVNLPALLPYRSIMQTFADARVASSRAAERVARRYGVQGLGVYGDFTRAELAALALLIDYIELTQKRTDTPLNPPVRTSTGDILTLDAATRRNLELTSTLMGERKGSLLAAIDRTVTAAGARQLARDMAAPLTDRAAIEKRLALVQDFVSQTSLRTDVRRILADCPDLERALTRLSLGRGGPRDLLALRQVFDRLAMLRSCFAPLATSLCAPLLQLVQALPDMSRLHDRLARTLRDEVPFLTRDGGLVRAGHSPALDELLLLRDDSRRLIANLQAQYAESTGVPTLKIRHNNIFGYYIEVTPTQADKMLAQKEQFIHRQTLASGVRFTTSELADLDRRVSEAADKALALELKIFDELVAEVVADSASVRLLAALLARIDVSAALADGAVHQNYIAPTLCDDTSFNVVGARHPVVEDALRKSHGPAFVPNDCQLEGEQQLWLLTGPNMAGKSTFLRQNALIVILAQMGSFVPATSARIGIVDKVFSRVGAADDLARGQSTFMVEMVETAAILHQATPRSLVILDEIGRGTATYDGLSIAWATLEYLASKTKCRALFATHYHELTALQKQLPTLACHTLGAREHEGELIFLHEVKPGTADKSYGIHVAKLAGLPRAVITRAEEILTKLESTGSTGTKPSALLADLPLFTISAATAPAVPVPSPLLQQLATLDADSLTPKAALDVLYSLISEAKKEIG